MVLSGVYWSIFWRMRGIFLTWKVHWPICYVLAASFNIWILLLSQSPYCFEKDFLIPSERAAFIFFQLFSNRTWLSRGRRTRQGWRVSILEYGRYLSLGHGQKWETSITKEFPAPPDPRHTFIITDIFKEEISIQTPALLHTWRRQGFLLLDTSQS